MIRNAFTKLIVLLMAVSLAACTSYPSKQNVGVGVGAVTGGLLGSLVGGGTGQVIAIGAGAIVGGLIGGSIGKSMDETDQMKMNSALNNPPSRTTYWVNERTGVRYKVVTTRYVTINGNPNCRHYYTTAVINGKMQKVYGTACMQSNGVWQIIN